MHGSQDQHHGDDSGGSRNGVKLDEEESGKKPPKVSRIRKLTGMSATSMVVIR
jgi:hypothetical protein